MQTPHTASTPTSLLYIHTCSLLCNINTLHNTEENRSASVLNILTSNVDHVCFTTGTYSTSCLWRLRHGDSVLYICVLLYIIITTQLRCAREFHHRFPLPTACAQDSTSTQKLHCGEFLADYFPPGCESERFQACVRRKCPSTIFRGSFLSF